MLGFGRRARERGLHEPRLLDVLECPAAGVGLRRPLVGEGVAERPARIVSFAAGVSADATTAATSMSLRPGRYAPSAYEPPP
jgi:hypothetical protein